MANPVADPGPLLQPIGDEAGAPAQPSLDGNAVGTFNGKEPESEEVLLVLQFAETSLDSHGLKGGSCDAVRRFARLNALQQTIELYTAIEVLKNRCINSTAAYDFARSQTFTTHGVNRLKILLLAPHTMYYVCGELSVPVPVDSGETWIDYWTDPTVKKDIQALINKSVAMKLKEKANIVAKTSKHGPHKAPYPQQKSGKKAPSAPSTSQKPSTSKSDESGGGTKKGKGKHVVSESAAKPKGKCSKTD
ncbi:hypothetical protein RSOL_109910, partial [Rhizoctonia solani AG-3 Rhs1AP]